jgi:GcrA cell cycle regulator
MTANPWAIHGPAIEARLRELHAQETPTLSFAVIANMLTKEFGTFVARNGAIGKAKRLGLTARGQTKSEKSTLAARASQTIRRLRKLNDGQPKAPDVRPMREADVVPLLVSFADLKHDQCRYPFGDSPPYQFCGCEKVPGLSYCEPHHRLTHSAHVVNLDLNALRRQQHREKMREAVTIRATGVA